MATPGWYPDPAGRPGAYRYWDGQAWGPDVTDNPFGGPQQPPPTPVAPANPFDPMGAPTTPPGRSVPDETVVAPTFQSYEGYGQPQPPQQPGPQQGWAPTPAQPSWASQPSYGRPTAPGPQKSNGGKVVGIVLLALVLTVALGIGSFFVVRSLTDDDDQSATDDPTSQTTDDPTSDPSTEPTQDPTEDPTEVPTPSTGDDPVDPFADPATPTARQCGGGRPEQGVTGAVGNQITGGGLTMRKARGFGQGPDQSGAFVFADGVTSTSKVIEQVGDTGWIAVYMLGGLTRANGFDSPGQAAGLVLECMTGSDTFYNGITGATLLDSRLTTVDGAPAWVMDAEIRIDDPQLTVEGDIAKVVVVDIGDPERYGLFVSLAPIGDDALIAQQDSQQALLKLGG